MLIDFSVTNFRSINERQTFSMQAVSRIGEFPNNIIENNSTNLLRSAVIYGRNASGKSNILKAMDCLSNLVKKENYPLLFAYQPFKISVNEPEELTTFEVNFYAEDNKRYSYDISYTQEQIVKENLYHYPEGRKARLFLRNQEELTTEIPSLKDFYKNIYDYHTILSRLNFYKIEQLLPVFNFFSRHFITISFWVENFESFWMPDLRNILYKEKVMPYHIENLNKLIKVADTGIDSFDIKILEDEDTGISDEYGRLKASRRNNTDVRVKHSVYEGDKMVGFVDFDLDDESEGTKKLFLFGSEILDSLSDGDVLIVDELDKGLHPKLMQAIVRLFNNPKTNPNNAQLIFTTHDVSLLSRDMFRRDQIFITEKNLEGETSVYTIADIKGVRADVPLEKYLMKGVFGGVPVINEFDLEFNLSRKDEK